MTVWASVTYRAWRNGASRTAQRGDLCAFQPGFAPMTSIRSSVRLWRGLVRVPSWQVAHCLADGRLRIVLEAYQRPPTPLSILTLRNRLLLPKVRAFVDFLQQHWMHPRPPL
jgi:DNA-binding transcriptional LysR family regulator